MRKVLIYGGTTEGRRLAELLAENGLASMVCVATEYGEQTMEQQELVQVHCGRLSVEQMRELYMREAPVAVVDATHPFALEVSANIRESLAQEKASLYLRLERFVGEAQEKGIRYFENALECAKALEDTKGAILLTTGSKDLKTFTEKEEVRRRIVARVLPGMESLKLCYDSGLEGKQIIAMQGPFSEEMNLAQLSEYGISTLVTKESGVTGGMDTKLSAAQKLGVHCFVIRKPKAAEEGLSWNQVLKELEKRLDQRLSFTMPQLGIILAGIGMGNADSMTLAVHKAIKEADYVFGAKRMLEQIHTSATCYPYYLQKDIFPVLEELKKTAYKDLKIVVLFSGDAGFYSGATKLYEALREEPQARVKILPGISSVSALSAAIGYSWQDSAILSMHGVKEEKWSRELLSAIREREKVFFLTSGPEDVRRLGALLCQEDLKKEQCKIYLGYQLSYPEEKLLELTPEECLQVTEAGLYCGMAVQTKKSAELMPSSQKASLAKL